MAFWPMAATAGAEETSSRLEDGDWFAVLPSLATTTPAEAAQAAALAASPSVFDVPPASQPTTTSAPAEEAPAKPRPKPWEVKFKVYAWIPSIDGHVGVRRVTSSLSVDYCDVLEALDKVEAMVPINAEVRWGHWGFIFDLLYVKLEDTVGRGPLRANVVGKQTIMELAGFYRVGTWQLTPGKSRQTLTLDILGGARFNELGGSFGLETPNHAIALNGTRYWWDPFVGPRVIWQPIDKLSVFARGDIGGFGIENCSNIVWQIIAGAEYDITKNVFVELGYRLLDTDYKTGSGRDHFSYDINMAGPYMAVGVKF